MAVLRLFPIADTTIYTEYPTLNAGIDAILDLSKSPSINNPSYSATSRILMKFDQNQIMAYISTYMSGSPNISASLGLYLCEATSMPVNYTLRALAVSESWDQGTGRFVNSPSTANGACWSYKDVNFTNWNSASFNSDVTCSYFAGNNGGGNWYTDFIATESFNVSSVKDVNIDVSPIVNYWISGSIPNNGFLIKNDDSIEFNSNIVYTLMYFSKDTNTIYPPYLDLKWDDSNYSPNTSSMPILNTNNVVTSILNNGGEFATDDVIQMRVACRPQYPSQIFTTASIYSIGNYLPITSYWRIRDVDTNLIVVDFDYNFTKISADGIGNYFILYMNALEPERYYKVEIKMILSGSSQIFQDQYFFKTRPNGGSS